MEIMVAKCYTDGKKEYFKYRPTPVKTIFNPPATNVINMINSHQKLDFLCVV